MKPRKEKRENAWGREGREKEENTQERNPIRTVYSTVQRRERRKTMTVWMHNRLHLSESRPCAAIFYIRGPRDCLPRHVGTSMWMILGVFENECPIAWVRMGQNRTRGSMAFENAAR